MPRLRTTATLSLLALLIGVAGTAWLSDQTAGRAEWPGLRARTVARTTHHRIHHRALHPVAVIRRHHVPVTDHAAAFASAQSQAVPLIPVSMPTTSLPMSRMRHHDAGHLVLHLVIDGEGEVTGASVAQSSGDAILDANAMAIAQHWRFAVPVDHPQGFSGDLPMRFTTSAPLAQTL